MKRLSRDLLQKCFTIFKLSDETVKMVTES